jgi:hypothetical protein
MGAACKTPPHQQTYLLAQIDLKSSLINMAATHMQFVPYFVYYYRTH